MPGIDQQSFKPQKFTNIFALRGGLKTERTSTAVTGNTNDKYILRNNCRWKTPRLYNFVIKRRYDFPVPTEMTVPMDENHGRSLLRHVSSNLEIWEHVVPAHVLLKFDTASICTQMLQNHSGREIAKIITISIRRVTRRSRWTRWTKTSYENTQPGQGFTPWER